jgi:hypothetical protein
VSFIWALTVITTVSAEVNNYSYIKEYDDRTKCEINKAVFIVNYRPFNNNEQVKCVIVYE